MGTDRAATLLSLLGIGLAACFQSTPGAAPQADPAAARGDANRSRDDAVAPSGAGAPAPEFDAAGGWPSVRACGAECACPGGLGAGVGVCLDDGWRCDCPTPEERGQRCTPGHAVSCTCADGRRGTQLCEPSGDSFSDCTCS